MKHELVKNWMSQNVVTIRPDATLPEANQLLKEKRIRRLPVVDAAGKLVGIITLGDMRGAEPSPATSLSIWESNYLLAKLPVRQFMTPNPVTVSEEATLGEAAQMMLAHRVSGLPVLDQRGDLVGIITESDIFRMVVLYEWQAEETALEAA